MFSFRTTPLDRQEDLVLRKGSLAVLCNQSAWDPERQEYLFEALYRRRDLRGESGQFFWGAARVCFPRT